MNGATITGAVAFCLADLRMPHDEAVGFVSKLGDNINDTIEPLEWVDQEAHRKVPGMSKPFTLKRKHQQKALEANDFCPGGQNGTKRVNRGSR